MCVVLCCSHYASHAALNIISYTQRWLIAYRLWHLLPDYCKLILMFDDIINTLAPPI